MSTGRTSVSQHVDAPRADVYRALLNADALIAWRVPDGMRGVVHLLEPRVGGRLRMSLIYDDDRHAAGAMQGKSDADTDTSESTFIALVSDEKVVESIVFESDDPRFAGTMIMTTLLED
ncbi:MAG TPA: SRPBCC domain-containing protein, partial [Myxococcota bacterium]